MCQTLVARYIEYSRKIAYFWSHFFYSWCIQSKFSVVYCVVINYYLFLVSNWLPDYLQRKFTYIPICRMNRISSFIIVIIFILYVRGAFFVALEAVLCNDAGMNKKKLVAFFVHSAVMNFRRYIAYVC